MVRADNKQQKRRTLVRLSKVVVGADGVEPPTYAVQRTILFLQIKYLQHRPTAWTRCRAQVSRDFTRFAHQHRFCTRAVERLRKSPTGAAPNGMTKAGNGAWSDNSYP